MSKIKFGCIANNPMAQSFCNALNELGFDAECCPQIKPSIDPNVNEYDNMFAGMKKNDKNYDYIMLNGACHEHFRAIPDYCKQNNKKFIYWASEDPVYYRENEYMFQHADIILSPAIENVAKYKALNRNAYLFMFATDHSYHKPGKHNATYDIDLMAQFSYYNWDCRLKGYDIILQSAKKMSDVGHSLQVWGAFWDSTGANILGQNYSNLYKGYMCNSHLPDVCVSSKIVLGVQCCDSSKTQQSMRSFEILGCKGFHMTQWTPSMDYWFENNKHLVAVKTQEEALEKMKYYLANEQERQKIAQQGYDYVHSKHTYVQRIQETFLKDVLS